MAGRIGLIDSAKGLSIILVVIHHSDLKEYVYAVDAALGLVRIPLFFFLSGVLFNTSRGLKALVVNKTDALLKPYFVTLLLVWLVSLALVEDTKPWPRLGGILYGVGETIEWPWMPAWYLTHLWLVFIFCWLFITVTRFRLWSEPARLIYVGASLLVGAYTLDIFWMKPIVILGYSYTLLGLPFSLDIILVSSAYFLLGYSCRERVLAFKPRLDLGLAGLGVLVGAMMFSNPEIDINERIYSAPLVAALASCCGIYLALACAYGLDRQRLIGGIFAFVGGQSIFILLFHGYFYELFYPWLAFVESNGLRIGLALAGCLSLALVIGVLVRGNRYLARLYVAEKARPSTPAGPR